MEQTNGTERKEKLVISFSIAKGKGVELSKEIATMFREQKRRYKFFMTKQSYFYRFSDFYIKIYADKYGESKMEILVYKEVKEMKGILEDVLSKAQKYYIDGEKNSMFLCSYSKFRLDDKEGLLTKLNEKSNSEFCYMKEGNIYNLSIKIKYNMKAEGKDDTFEDNIFILMPIQKGILVFLPNLVPKIFSEKERVRIGVKKSMEEII
ncbi:MAG: hypothetical protein J6A15_08325 [Clostridia bacterium]|nr:hypothetical protein [Clostridia bacterium]